MVNARDALAVVAWISALAMTMVSGFATLLQVDDSEATGGAMVLYLVRLAVEGLFFCTLVGDGMLIHQYFCLSVCFSIFFKFVRCRPAGSIFNFLGCTERFPR